MIIFRSVFSVLAKMASLGISGSDVTGHMLMSSLITTCTYQGGHTHNLNEALAVSCQCFSSMAAKYFTSFSRLRTLTVFEYESCIYDRIGVTSIEKWNQHHDLMKTHMNRSAIKGQYFKEDMNRNYLAHKFQRVRTRSMNKQLEEIKAVVGRAENL